MNKYEAIYKRRSVRKYSEERLSSDILDEIKEGINYPKKLYQNIDSHMILETDGKKIQNTFSGIKSKVARVDAPHYLIGVSEKRDGYLVNMGYMVEDMVLSLTKKRIGSCWLGAGFDKEVLKNMYDLDGNPVILVAFGDSIPEKDNLRKDPGSASRKDIRDLVLNDKKRIPPDWKDILEAVRMAPSAMNSQPWRFCFEENIIHVYIEKGGRVKQLVKKISDLRRLNRIDAGIALKHLEISAKEHSKNIRFKDLVRKREKQEYVISVLEE